MRSCLLAGLLILALGSSRPAQASINMRALLTTTSYGVVVGTLVGVASLAFFDSPSQHYRNVAIGSSLGLYAGVAIWAYLTYVPKGSPETPGQPKPKVAPDNPIMLDGGQGSIPTLQPYLTVANDGHPRAGLLLRF